MDTRPFLFFLLSCTAAAALMLDDAIPLTQQSRALKSGSFSADNAAPTTVETRMWNGKEIEVESRSCPAKKGIGLQGGTLRIIEDIAMPCACCIECDNEPECKSWVYNEKLQKCDLKRLSSEDLPHVKCKTCYTSVKKKEAKITFKCQWSKGEEVVDTSSTTVDEWTTTKETAVSVTFRGVTVTWIAVPGMWMPRSASKKVCTSRRGYDQPAEFNLPDQPSYLEHPFECCNACLRKNGTCRSWVFNLETQECFLKSDYDPSQNTIPCATCVAFDASSETYVYQDEKTESFDATEPGFTWTQPFFGGAWGKWSGTEKCTFKVGEDQPATFNLFDRPLFFDAAYKCCDACRLEPRCASWVWKATKHHCFLKSEYPTGGEPMPCVDCISYDREGDHFLFFYDSRGHKWPQTDEEVEPKDRTWASETRPWMPESIASDSCRVSYGFNQPAEFDMLQKPLVLPFPFMCCDECAKDDRCKSWVYNLSSNACSLKFNYSSSERGTPCEDCVGFDSTGTSYVFHNVTAMYVMTTAIFTSTTDPREWTETRYGEGTHWGPANDDTPGNYIEGFDQPQEFNINNEPMTLDEAGKCRYACESNPRCRSWVWRANLHECYLKSIYNETLSFIPCDDCVAHADGGDYYLYWLPVDVPTLQPYSLLISKGEAIERCSYTTGKDQPAQFNLFEEPTSESSAFFCCNACAKHPLCKSWVWRFKTKECYLKSAYFENGPRTNCADCIAFEASGFSFAFVSIEQLQEKRTPAAVQEPRLGEGEKWALSNGTEQCTFVEGFDLPLQDDLDVHETASAYDCCAACGQRTECEAWVWRRTTKSCRLKTRVYVGTELVHCDDCVAYSPAGRFYALPCRPLESEQKEGQDKAECACSKVLQMPVTLPSNRHLRVHTSFDCCTACRLSCDCNRWIYRQSTGECLVMKPDTWTNGTRKCEDCFGNDPLGKKHCENVPVERSPSPEGPSYRETTSDAEKSVSPEIVESQRPDNISVAESPTSEEPAEPSSPSPFKEPIASFPSPSPEEPAEPSSPPPSEEPAVSSPLPSPEEPAEPSSPPPSEEPAVSSPLPSPEEPAEPSSPPPSTEPAVSSPSPSPERSTEPPPPLPSKKPVVSSPSPSPEESAEPSSPLPSKEPVVPSPSPSPSKEPAEPSSPSPSKEPVVPSSSSSPERPAEPSSPSPSKEPVVPSSSPSPEKSTEPSSPSPSKEPVASPASPSPEGSAEPSSPSPSKEPVASPASPSPERSTETFSPPPVVSSPSPSPEKSTEPSSPSQSKESVMLHSSLSTEEPAEPSSPPPSKEPAVPTISPSPEKSTEPPPPPPEEVITMLPSPSPPPETELSSPSPSKEPVVPSLSPSPEKATAPSPPPPFEEEIVTLPSPSPEKSTEPPPLRPSKQPIASPASPSPETPARSPESPAPRKKKSERSPKKCDLCGCQGQGAGIGGGGGGLQKSYGEGYACRSSEDADHSKKQKDKAGGCRGAEGGGGGGGKTGSQAHGSGHEGGGSGGGSGGGGGGGGGVGKGKTKKTKETETKTRKWGGGGQWGQSRKGNQTSAAEYDSTTSTVIPIASPRYGKHTFVAEPAFGEGYGYIDEDEDGEENIEGFAVIEEIPEAEQDEVFAEVEVFDPETEVKNATIRTASPREAGAGSYGRRFSLGSEVQQTLGKTAVAKTQPSAKPREVYRESYMETDKATIPEKFDPCTSRKRETSYFDQHIEEKHDLKHYPSCHGHDGHDNLETAAP